jgi:hypothetical protein
MPVDARQTLREGRRTYFAENGLPPDGGYDDAWVVIRVGGLPVLAFPNTADRRRAVPFHDLHHVVTGYGTDLIGEAEIGAWELASDCSASRAATFLNLQVFGFMLPLHRARLLRAFLRGRRSRNLYGGPPDENDPLLGRSVGRVREELGVDRPCVEAGPEDRAAWRRWCVTALALVWGPLVPLFALAAWWLAG